MFCGIRVWFRQASTNDDATEKVIVLQRQFKEKCNAHGIPAGDEMGYISKEQQSKGYPPRVSGFVQEFVTPTVFEARKNTYERRMLANNVPPPPEPTQQSLDPSKVDWPTLGYNTFVDLNGDVRHNNTQVKREDPVPAISPRSGAARTPLPHHSKSAATPAMPPKFTVTGLSSEYKGPPAIPKKAPKAPPGSKPDSPRQPDHPPPQLTEHNAWAKGSQRQKTAAKAEAKQEIEDFDKLESWNDLKGIMGVV